MEFVSGYKRGRRHENGNGGLKKIQATFSTSGCQFGEGCHFLHYVHGGMKAVSQMLTHGVNSVPPPAVLPPSFPDGSSAPAVKSRICKRYNSAEGCKFGDKCHFAHGEWELGMSSAHTYEDPRGIMPNRMGDRFDPPQQGFGAVDIFGASATAKISVHASLAGRIIGKNGVNSKQICRATGAKLSIRDHESDLNLRNIELEGTFDQIKKANGMVRELIVNIGSASSAHSMKNQSIGGQPTSNNFKNSSSNNFKTKICENFMKSSCTFGDRCHFAHGPEELRKSSM